MTTHDNALSGDELPDKKPKSLSIKDRLLSHKKLAGLLIITTAAVTVVAVVAVTFWPGKTTKPLSAADFATAYAAKPDVVTSQTYDCHPPSKDHEWYRTDRTLTVDYTDPNIMYVNVEWLGVYKTIDGGKTWQQKTKGIKVYARADDLTKGCYSEYPMMQMDPTNHLHIILATSGGGGGFLDDTTPNSQTGGAYQTFDGGEHWQLMITNTMDIYTSDVVMDPTDPKTVYYGTSSGPASWAGADQNKKYVTKGLIYKTTDGAKTWEELPTGIGSHATVTQILVNPENTQEIVAPTFSAIRLSGDGTGTGKSNGKDTSIEQLGILHSTDGGQTWSQLVDLPSTPSIAAMFATPHNFKHLIFAGDNRSGLEMPYSYVLTNGTTLQKTKFLDYVVYDPFDVAGDHAIGFTTASVGSGSDNLFLYESRDGGITWTKHGTLPKEIKDPNEGTTRITKIIWHPTDPNTLFMSGGSGLVWKSTDLGSTWTKLLDYSMLSH